MSIYIYYHITLLNNWKQVISEQCTRIIFTGLYDKVNEICCYIIDPLKTNSESCINLLQSFGNKFQVKNTDVKGDEWFTLKNLCTNVKENDKILYIHSKGVTRYGTNTYSIHETNYYIPNLYENISDWRNLMEYYLIAQHDKCINKLDTHDTVGINLCTTPIHYSGNFWWATGKYIQKIPIETIGTEDWILSERSCNFCTLYQSPLVGYGHYFHSFPLSMYIDMK